MAWWGLSLLFVAFAVILWVPGTVVLRVLGARGVLSLGAAPAVTSAFYAVLALLYAATGVPWRPLTVSVAVTVTGLLLLGARRARWWASARRRAGDAPPRRDLSVGWLGSGAVDALRHRRAWLVLALVVGTVVAVLPVAVGMGEPGAPLQQWDAVFHLNGVAFIHETGDASSIDGLYGAGSSVYYPTVWHSMVALVPGDLVGPASDAVTAAANASTLVIGSVGLLTGIGAFAAACFPRRPEVTVLAVAVGGAFSMFPTVLLSTLAQWPNGLSIMLVPGAAALWVALLKSDRGSRAAQAVAALGALVGVGGAHGSGVVGLAVVVGPLAVAVGTGGVRRAWSAGHRRVVVWCAGALLVGAVVLGYLVVRSSVLQVLFGFERESRRGYAASVVRTLLDVVLSAWPGNLVVSVAVLGGAVVLARARAQRWLIVSGVLVVVLVALAAGPETPLRAVTGIWYTQAARIEALYPIVASVLAAVGLAALAGAVGRAAEQRGSSVAPSGAAGRTAAGVVVLALLMSLGYQAPGRADRFAEAYDPASIRWGTMLSPQELELMRGLRSVLAPDALVLGDPHNGAAFAFAVGGRHVVLPQLGTSAMDEAQTYLRAHFRDVATDPQVCRFVEDLGVTHYYEDSAGRADGAKVDPESPGLHDVDTSEGFVVVAEAGSATLWRIDACR